MIAKGEVLLVQDKAELIAQLGKKQLRIDLLDPLDTLPPDLAGRGLEVTPDGHGLIYTYDTRAERTGITTLLNDLQRVGLHMTDLSTSQSSLEDIFVGLVKENA